jgi:phage terminase large subunit-like protein
MDWSTACSDWESRIMARQSLVPCDPLFPAEAEQALEVLRDLRIIDVPGSPTFGTIMRPWVRDFVAAIFGSYDHETGRRLIREYLLLISKKNTKSTLAAGIMLTALIRNWRLSAEYMILAPTMEVANNSFGPASDMVKSSAALSSFLKVNPNTRTILHEKTGASLKVVAADNDVVSGKKATGVLIDELWLFGKRSNAENMLREATGGLASRPEGFVIYLSTQSDQAPAGIFKQKLDYFRDVRDGRVVDRTCMPVLYEFPPRLLAEKKYLKPDFFYVTNPNLGASVDAEFLATEAMKAERGGPGSLQGFLAKHLNVEIGLALQSDRWAGADHWQAAAEPALGLDDLLARCDVVTIGIDGGGLDDLLGLSLIGRERETRRWLSWSRAWANPIVLERRKDIAPKLRDLALAGDLVITAKLGQDIEEIVDICCQVKDAGLLPEKAGIGLDPVGIGQIVDALAEQEIADPVVVGVPQGWKISGAIKTSERKLADGTLVHAEQPLMDWCVGNAKVEPRGNAVMITKQTAGTAKIDPLMALFNATALMSMNPGPRGSIYDREDLWA